MPEKRCLLCVHAHPDDEALFSAGVMARYHAEGVRSVLITFRTSSFASMLSMVLVICERCCTYFTF